MHRLREIRQKLERLSEMDEQLENCEEWNVVAQDIIQKLSTMRRECERCSTSSLLLTPPNSTSSGSLHSENSISTDNVYQEATEAYEHQIYSRCVRLVETANRESPVDMCLISLAHHSYAEMVTAAGSSDDALKFARWWAEFLDSVEAGRSHNEKIELLDYEAIAYEKIVRLGNENSLENAEDFEKLIEVVVRSFEMVTLLNRPYHIMSLQRLRRLGNVLDNDWNNVSEYSISYAKNILISGIQNVIRDRKKFVQTGRISDQEIDNCDEILTQILELDLVQTVEDFTRTLSPIPPIESHKIVLRL